MFRKLVGKYLFSRFKISNDSELGFTLKGVYTQEESPYTIYVYETGETAGYLSRSGQ